MARGKTGKKGKGSKGFNKKNSQEFLDKNRNKEGVIELPSGLQYMVIDSKDGNKPEFDNDVTVYQRITLIDGTVVADSYKKNEPDTFPISEAIEGYKEGLLMMEKGSRYRFFIPSELGWGKRGAGDKIGPDSVIIIDARLDEII